MDGGGVKLERLALLLVCMVQMSLSEEHVQEDAISRCVDNYSEQIRQT